VLPNGGNFENVRISSCPRSPKAKRRWRIYSSDLSNIFCLIAGFLRDFMLVIAAGAIFLTTFVTDAYQFIALRVIIGSIQAGIPPSLLGGKGTRGAAMGFLNSARFMGMAIGPFLATSILGNGETPKVLYMFTTMTGMSLLSSLVTYLTHTRQSQD
jgi:MFS family permease